MKYSEAINWGNSGSFVIALIGENNGRDLFQVSIARRESKPVIAYKDLQVELFDESGNKIPLTRANEKETVLMQIGDGMGYTATASYTVNSDINSSLFAIIKWNGIENKLVLDKRQR